MVIKPSIWLHGEKISYALVIEATPVPSLTTAMRLRHGEPYSRKRL